MKQFAALGDTTRLRIVEHLATADRTAGELVDLVSDEFGISQPATSRHLRVLRESDLVTTTVDGNRRIYRLQKQQIEEIASWVDELKSLWGTSLDALSVEIVRGQRKRREQEGTL